MKSYQQFYEYDLFGYSVKLYINGNTKEGTLFGLITTLIYIICFIGVTIYYITETFNKKNYTFSTSTIEYEEAVSIILDKEIFAFNFALQDPITYVDYIDETIYQIKANLVTGIRDPVTQNFLWYNEEIKAGPCSSDMFSENNQNFYKEGFNNKYCLYDINKKNLTGNFAFDHYSRIVISFYSCVNSTENNNHCKSKDEIDYYLNSTYVGVTLLSVTIDEKHIPMTRNYVESPFTTVGENFFKDYQLSFKIIETEEDDGIILKSKKFGKTLQFESTKEMASINRKVYDDSFCDITIKLSDRKTVYKKSYEKIPNALYKVGGIMPVIYYIIKICLLIPVKTIYEINAINKVFKFDMTKIIKKRNERGISKIICNFNSDSKILKNKIKEDNLNVLKSNIDENIKNNSKNTPIPESLYFKNNTDLNIKIQNIIDIQNDSSANINNKNLVKKNFLMKNIFKHKKRSNNSPFSNFRENIEKENKNYKKYTNHQEESKYIVDMIKISWYQFLCHYPFKHCSHNIKIILAENGRKFYMQNLDIINVFQNIIMMKKLYDYFLTNKRIFGFHNYNNDISFYDKPIITDD